MQWPAPLPRWPHDHGCEAALLSITAMTQSHPQGTHPQLRHHGGLLRARRQIRDPGCSQAQQRSLVVGREALVLDGIAEALSTVLGSRMRRRRCSGLRRGDGRAGVIRGILCPGIYLWQRPLVGCACMDERMSVQTSSGNEGSTARTWPVALAAVAATATGRVMGWRAHHHVVSSVGDTLYRP